MISVMFSVILISSLCNVLVISERGYANFPYDDCSTGEMDVMCLYYTKKYENWQRMCPAFWDHLLSFPHNKTVPRVMFAAVYDWFSVDDPNVNVSSWHFYESLGNAPYGSEDEEKIQEYTNVNETIERKVKFVQRLFSEMTGVREQAAHIAVVFIDGEPLSIEESSSIPFILQQQDTSINIFVVVMGGTSEIVHLRDTLVVNVDLPSLYKHILALAMCDQCLQGWWRFEQKAGAYSLSCYKIITSGEGSDYHDSNEVCWMKENTDLVSIESRDELTFLQNTLYSHFDEIRQRNKTVPFSAHFFLSLVKDTPNIAIRFFWELFQRRIKRPLALTHWMNGKPTAGEDQIHVVWQFDWIEEIRYLSNASSHNGHFVDGWVDTARTLKCVFTVCKVPFYRRIGDNRVTLSPPTDETLNRAVNRGSFVKFQNNLVSVSSNLVKKDFLQFIQQTGYETFPVFDCGPDARSPRYISYSRVCDKKDDCSNTRDEDLCSDKRILGCRQLYEYCNGILCCDGSCLLHRWVNDGEIDCPVCNNSTGMAMNDESEYLLKKKDANKTCAIYCYREKCIDISQLNDGHFDCFNTDGSYAPLDETIGKLERAETCRDRKGQIKWAPKCVYVKDDYEAVLGCRDMSHLENCADFVCPPGYFKCPSRYCIPQHYVLNGASDCPSGEDEQEYNIGPCTGNFACWNSKICLYPDLVCDGHPDCPHKDDEVDCNLNVCAAGFRCVSGTITLSTYNKLVPLTSLPKMYYTARYIDLSGVDISAVISLKMALPTHISVLKFSECKIRLLGIFFNANEYCIQDMDLSFNFLHILDVWESLSNTASCLRSLNISFNPELKIVKNLKLDHLETLDLSHTGLSHLNDNSFNRLHSLKHLDLSFTAIGHLYKRIFSSMFNLKTLNLRGIYSDVVYEDIFNGLSIIQDLYTDSFEICCPQIRGNMIPAHTCHAPDDAISSCFDLLGVDIQRFLLWVVAVLAVLGNVTVIVYRVIWDRSVLKTGYGLFVTNLGISDFIMGVYLFIIAGADYYYRGIYVLYDKTWKGSITCKFASFLASISSETSIFFVFFITLDRFLVMKFPFGQVRLTKINRNVAVCLCWLIGILLALTPVVFKFKVFSSNAMCVSLPLSIKRLHGWEFSFGVFIVINFIVCVAIAVGQRAIFRAMSENRITGAATITSPRRAADIMVAKQLSLVALSNFLCWFPVGFMGFLSLSGHEISNDVYAWTTIIVIPINSAANPLLYTIPLIIDKWHKFKFRHSMSK